MTATSGIESIWESSIGDNSDLQAYTEQFYTYQVLNDREKQSEKLYYQDEINFITVDVTRGARPEINGCKTYNFDIAITYTLKRKLDGSSEKQIKTVFELIETLVESELGNTWLDTIESYEYQSSPVKLVQVIVDDTLCWQGTYTYKASKFVQL